MKVAPPTPTPARRLASIPRSGIRQMLETTRRPDMVDLAAGDPSFDTPVHIVEAASSAAAAGKTHYTHGRGELLLREAIARKLAQQNGITSDPEREIVVTAGALNGLAATFIALLDPGDEVLVPNPAFANYEAQIALAGGTPVPVPLTRDWQIDLDAVRDRLSQRTRAIVLNSPANPTGAVLERSSLESLASILEGSPIMVISDEAYEDLIYRPAEHVSVASLAGFADRAISIFSFSKTYAMTGWRLGYVVAPAGLGEALTKVQEHLVGCASAVSQAAGLAALQGPREPTERMLDEYLQRRQKVVAALAATDGVSLIAPTGAFYAFPRVERLGASPARALAEGAGVMTVPGEAFGAGGAGCVRISFAGSSDVLELGLGRLRAFLRGGDPS